MLVRDGGKPAGLAHRILRQVLMVAGGASLLFGLLFLALYRDQFERERSAASVQVNQLLRIALENAMLKRDVPGLRDIVARMGELPAIREVMILAPGGEVRFASRQERLGLQLPELAGRAGNGAAESHFLSNAEGEAVLRSINPVSNRAACTGCHGSLEKSPINGILVVDYRADTLREQAWRSAALFAAAGAIVLALTLWTLWRMLRRRVIEPLYQLDAAARELAAGNLGVRAPTGALDEPGRLAASFNVMADGLAEHIAAVEREQRYLQELIDGLPDGVRVIRQSDLAILAVNRAYCSQLGVAPASAVGQPCHRSSHGRDSPCPPTMVVCPAVELQVPGQSLKCRHHHRTVDGREVPVEVHAVLLERSGERIIVESTSDLSEVAKYSQEQRLSELGLLAAGIAHEIHNPLGSMRLAVEGLLRAVRNDSVRPERVVDYLEMINAEIDRCTGVTQRLLLLSRLPQQQAQVVALNPAVGDTLGLLDFDARSRGIVQNVELDPGDPRVLADDSDLRMLVLNLVQNAHHAMPGGGRLDVRTMVAGGCAVIEVCDSGRGIADQDLGRIFDPFFSHRADGEGGTGLGLTICKSIVDRYGGTITVSSMVGQGATFRVVLPLAGE